MHVLKFDVLKHQDFKSKKIKLTDYKIDPPSYLLGAMKVANELTIQYNLTFKK